MELTDSGLIAVDPDRPKREQTRIRIELAIQNVPIFKGLYERSVGNRLPSKIVLVDYVKDNGVDQSLADEAVDTFIVNLTSVGLLQTLSGAERVVTVEHLLDSLPASNLAVHQAPIAAHVISNSVSSKYDTSCFYITPIGPEGSELRKHSDLILESIVAPAINTLKLDVIRADNIAEPGNIPRQIFEFVMKAKLVVADLSFHNANVFYELALRHAVKLPIVHLIRSGDTIPFDINQFSTVIIDTTDIYSLVPKLETYKSEIATHARSALENPSNVSNPLSAYFPELRVTIG